MLEAPNSVTIMYGCCVAPRAVRAAPSMTCDRSNVLTRVAVKMYVACWLFRAEIARP